MRRAILLAALLAASAAAQPGTRDRRRPPDPCLPAPQLYIAPMGQVFRAGPSEPYPVAAWFGAADVDGDGRITLPEFLADAERAFAAFDADRNGEIEPPELSAYETNVAPEIRLYQGGRPLLLPNASRKERREAASYAGSMGAGRYAQLNIPHPIASADLDFNRGITREEWRATATRRFQQLGPSGGALTMTGLKPTPVQQLRAQCDARAAKRKR